MKSGFEVPWYNCVPSGTVARNNDIPLWLRLPPHWRIEEWIALKMWFALQIAASPELATTGLKSAESDNKEMGALRCILTISQVSAVRCSQALKQNKTVAGHAREETEAETEHEMEEH